MYAHIGQDGGRRPGALAVATVFHGRTKDICDGVSTCLLREVSYDPNLERQYEWTVAMK
jgi:hypothetical protein